MTDHTARVVAGVDAHTDEHHVAVLDLQGRLLATAAFSTTGVGYARLIAWLRAYGSIERVGVESTAAYAAALVRELLAHGISVVEVNQPHPHARQRLGKSDPIDAELAARAALSGTASWRAWVTFPSSIYSHGRRALPKRTSPRRGSSRAKTLRSPVQRRNH